MTKKGREYKQKVKAIMHDLKLDQEMLALPLKATFYLYMPDKRKRDNSNALKAIEDALQDSGFIADDFYICDERTIKVYDNEIKNSVKCKFKILKKF